MKTVAFLVLAFAIGAAARYFDLPYLSPPKLLGILGVAALTAGGAVVDYLMRRP